ncbi:MAG: DHH family phosphoesterase [Lactobacillaceae bacterium]|jgi:c-di-AMP phosphodiesterase-like protein|nr:DHH family phosphoesterase [Lactobacillaceae bacterium]
MSKINNFFKKFSKFQGPIFAIIFMILNITGFVITFINNKTLSVFWVILSIISSFLLYRFYTNSKNNIKNLSDYYSGRVGIGQMSALDHMPIGAIILDRNGTIEWANKNIINFFNNEDILGKKIVQISPELSEQIGKNIDNQESVEIILNKTLFSLQVQQNGNAIYLLDLSDSQKYKILLEKNKIFNGIISVDNYEEIVQDISDSEGAQIRAYISTVLNKWAEDYELYIRRLNADRFIFFGYNGSLEKLEKEKFQIIDEIRKDSSKQNLPLSLSIGVASGIHDLNKLSDSALSNLDLAQGRGGDQVVIRDDNGSARFIGGNSNPMEKRTRVRARMIEKAISDLMRNADNVLIMGHKNPDLDSIGAALGVWRLSEKNNKTAKIIIDTDSNINYEIKKIIDLKNKENKEKEIDSPFVDIEKAKQLIKKNSLLILVDHSRPAISTDQSIVNMLSSKIIIIDHHRVSDDPFPEKPLLFYSEQYASSTSELVSELLSYEDLRKSPITKIESSAMLAGIQLDTKGFTQNAGSRTFDSASFLRSMGADNKLILDITKVESNNLIEKAKLLAKTNVDKNIAYVVGENHNPYDLIVTAQVADELLKIKDVDASFVITRREDGNVGINARSNGKINTQIIMEKLGGGGSLMNSAAQIESTNIDNALELLKNIVKENKED